jgi:DNA replication protein DnaC
MPTIAEILQQSIVSPTNSKTSSNGNDDTLFGNDAPSDSEASPPSRLRHTGGDPTCPYCHGTGFIIPDVPPADPRFGRAVACACRQLAQETQRAHKLIELSQLGLLKDCTFSTFRPEGVGLNPQKQMNLKMVYERVLAYAQHPHGWLVLKGGYGCGKTHLAAAVANQRLQMGHPVLFVNVPDLLDHLRGAYAPGSPTSYDERFEQIRNSSLLILDDLGTQSNTEWAQEKLYQIFNHRYTARLPTVVTTNEELESIEIRIRSRLADSAVSQILTLRAPDFRRAGVDQDQSDLSTLNLHGDKRFDSFDLRDQELTRAQAENLRRAFDLAKSYAENPQGWLVFNSVIYANGKTHLAAAIANHLSRDGDSVLFIVVPDLLDHLRAAFNPASGTTYDKRFNEVKTAPVLVLDDLGTESATAWAREKLYQLFNYRYNAQLPTIITTATPIDELDPRLASRMLDGSRCTFFLLEAPSYRGGAKRQRARRAGSPPRS